MDKRQKNTLVERWIAMKLFGTHAQISMSAFENDKRKQETLKHWNDRPDYVTAIRHNNLNNEQLAYVLLNADKFKFYIMIDGEITYRRGITEKVGPLQAFEVPNAYQELDKKLGFTHHPCLMVSTDELERVASEYATNEKIKRLVAVNLAWALEDQGVFEDGENEVPRKDSDKPANIIYSAPGDGLFFNGYGNLTDDPTKWDANLDSAINRCVDRINELQRNLTLLRKARKGINELGGMDKFVSTLCERIAEMVKKEG